GENLRWVNENSAGRVLIRWGGKEGSFTGKFHGANHSVPQPCGKCREISGRGTGTHAGTEEDGKDTSPQLRLYFSSVPVPVPLPVPEFVSFPFLLPKRQCAKIR